MHILNSLSKRRSYYELNNQLPVSWDQLIQTVQQVTALVPDAFDSKSSRIVLLKPHKHEQFWDLVASSFDGEISIDKIQQFKQAAGTILFFYDQHVVDTLIQQFPLYANQFPLWAHHASAMLQINIWTALRDMDIGANLQHYNPVIDANTRQFLSLPNNYQLVAQMPFGRIVSEPKPKENEDIHQRVFVYGP